MSFQAVCSEVWILSDAGGTSRKRVGTCRGDSPQPFTLDVLSILRRRRSSRWGAVRESLLIAAACPVRDQLQSARRWPEDRPSPSVRQGAPCRLPNDSRHGRVARQWGRTGRAPGEGPSMGTARRQAPASMPNQKRLCSAGRKQTQCTKREWCPASLVDLAVPRHGRRTQTLTGEATYTSTTAVLGDGAAAEGAAPNRWTRTD